MKIVETALKPVEGYIVSIKRNTINGWYELEVGLPVKWVYVENDEIKCEVLNKNNLGVLVKISPKNSNIVIDDLIGFVNVIIETNQKIAEKEKEFADKVEKMKEKLEMETHKFYEELDELKNNSFKQYSDNFLKNLHSNDEKEEIKDKKSKNKKDTSIFKSPGVSITERDDVQPIEIEKIEKETQPKE